MIETAGRSFSARESERKENIERRLSSNNICLKSNDNTPW